MSALPRAVVWDLDGTLIDSAADIAAVLNGLLRDHGLPTHDFERVRGMIGGGIPRLIERGWAASGGAPPEGGLAALSARFVERYAACATERTRLYPGVAETLAELSRRGVGQVFRSTYRSRALTAPIICSTPPTTRTTSRPPIRGARGLSR